MTVRVYSCIPCGLGQNCPSPFAYTCRTAKCIPEVELYACTVLCITLSALDVCGPFLVDVHQ